MEEAPDPTAGMLMAPPPAAGRGRQRAARKAGAVIEVPEEEHLETGSGQQPRRTCTACKASKVKCDRAAPVCGRCSRLKLTCIQQRRAQGRPLKYSSHVVMPPRLDRLPKEIRSDEKLWNETSAQWAADYMAYAFSNLVKDGGVNRIKTLAILRVWMLFSLYYGVDLTRGFLSVALALLEATVQDLFKIGEKVQDPLMLREPLKGEPAPDPATAEPIMAILQDEEAAIMCCVGCRGGVGASLCNDMFRKTFFRDDAAAQSALSECSLPIFKYAKIIAPEDRGEFMESLAAMCFGTQRGPAHISHISRVLDKDGNTFLAIIRLRSVSLGDGTYTADILTVEPVPASKYVVQISAEGRASSASSSRGTSTSRGRSRRAITPPAAPSPTASSASSAAATSSGSSTGSTSTSIVRAKKSQSRQPPAAPPKWRPPSTAIPPPAAQALVPAGGPSSSSSPSPTEAMMMMMRPPRALLPPPAVASPSTTPLEHLQPPLPLPAAAQLALPSTTTSSAASVTGSASSSSSTSPTNLLLNPSFLHSMPPGGPSLAMWSRPTQELTAHGLYSSGSSSRSGTPSPATTLPSPLGLGYHHLHHLQPGSRGGGPQPHPFASQPLPALPPPQPSSVTVGITTTTTTATSAGPPALGGGSQAQPSSTRPSLKRPLPPDMLSGPLMPSPGHPHYHHLHSLPSPGGGYHLSSSPSPAGMSSPHPFDFDNPTGPQHPLSPSAVAAAMMGGGAPPPPTGAASATSMVSNPYSTAMDPYAQLHQQQQQHHHHQHKRPALLEPPPPSSSSSSSQTSVGDTGGWGDALGIPFLHTYTSANLAARHQARSAMYQQQPQQHHHQQQHPHHHHQQQQQQYHHQQQQLQHRYSHQPHPLMHQQHHSQAPGAGFLSSVMQSPAPPPYHHHQHAQLPHHHHPHHLQQLSSFGHPSHLLLQQQQQQHQHHHQQPQYMHHPPASLPPTPLPPTNMPPPSTTTAGGAAGGGGEQVPASTDPGLPGCESFIGDWLLDDWINTEAGIEAQQQQQQQQQHNRDAALAAAVAAAAARTGEDPTGGQMPSQR